MCDRTHAWPWARVTQQQAAAAAADVRIAAPTTTSGLCSFAGVVNTIENIWSKCHLILGYLKVYPKTK
jgi:hypothetical protein